MRTRLFTAASLLLASLIAPQSAQAGSVLLPWSSGSGNTSASPNLGLGTQDSSSQNSTASTKESATKQAPASIPTPASVPTPSAPAAAATPLVNAPSSTADDNDQVQTPAPHVPTISEVFSSPVSPKDAANLPPGAIPTMVLHAPDMSGTLAKAYENLPQSLTIAISGKSFFGSNDVLLIGNKLGLARDQIASSCILTVRGLMLTSKGSYVIDGGASPRIPLRYEGTIQNYMMTGAALCQAGATLPAGSGLLTETNGRYTISLHAIKCPLPNRQTTTLTITYDGSDTAQCVYE